MENNRMDAWTLPTAIFFVLLSMTLAVMTWLAVAYPEAERVGSCASRRRAADRLFISLDHDGRTIFVDRPRWHRSDRDASGRRRN